MIIISSIWNIRYLRDIYIIKVFYVFKVIEFFVSFGEAFFFSSILFSRRGFRGSGCVIWLDLRNKKVVELGTYLDYYDLKVFVY